MKTFSRRENLRLAAITLYRAELIILLLGLAESVYDLIVEGAELKELLQPTTGMTFLYILATCYLLAGLKKSKFVTLGIGYFVYVLGTVLNFYSVSTFAASQFNEEEFSNIPLIVATVIMIAFIVLITILLIHQAKAEGRISDRDKNKWIIPGAIYLIGFFAYFVCTFSKFIFVPRDGRPMYLAIIIILFITLVFAKLLEVVAMFSCMKWLVSPLAVENDMTGGREE